MDTMKFTKATAKDMNLLLEIYNDKLVLEKCLNIVTDSIKENEISTTIEHFENNKFELLVIEKDSINIGITMIYDISYKSDIAKVGIVLLDKYRGQKLSNEIVDMLSKRIIEHYNIHNICGEVFSNNHIAISTLYKLGFDRLNGITSNADEKKGMKMMFCKKIT